MNGAFLLSEDEHLLKSARSVLLGKGATSSDANGGVVQLRDESGRLFTLYAAVPPEQDWEAREGPLTLSAGAPRPDMSSVSACPVECRWEDLFVSVVGGIAAQLPSRVWLLDGNDVLWPGDAVDAALVKL